MLIMLPKGACRQWELCCCVVRGNLQFTSGRVVVVRCSWLAEEKEEEQWRRVIGRGLAFTASAMLTPPSAPSTMEGLHKVVVGCWLGSAWRYVREVRAWKLGRTYILTRDKVGDAAKMLELSPSTAVRFR